MEKHSSYKHGLSRLPLYAVWNGMHYRCESTNSPAYKHYGGRGISVCEEWGDVITFYSWAIRNGYKKGLTIDRINNDGNYEPGNCRFADRKT